MEREAIGAHVAGITIKNDVLRIAAGLFAITILIAALWWIPDIGRWSAIPATIFVLVVIFCWIEPLSEYVSANIFRRPRVSEKEQDNLPYICTGIAVFGFLGFLVGVLTGYYIWGATWRPKDWPGLIALVAMSYLGTMVLIVATGGLLPWEKCDEMNSSIRMMSCYAIKAINANNVSECNSIGSQNAMIAALLQGETEAGNELNVSAFSWYRAQCYGVYAGHKETLSLCDNNFGGANRWSCYIGYGMETNASVCNMLEEEAAAHCGLAVAEFLNDSSSCAYLSDHPNAKGFCYGAYAYDRGNLTLCKGLDGTSRAMCYFTYGYKKEDASVCQELEDSGESDFCTIGMAIALNSTSLCDKTRGDPNLRGFCYGGVAASKGDISVCDAIPEQKSLCEMFYYNKTGIAAPEQPEENIPSPAEIPSPLDSCDMQSGLRATIECYRNTSTDYAGCDRISLENPRFSGLIRLEPNATYASMAVLDARAGCYGEMGWEAGNASVCSQFKGDEYLVCTGGMALASGNTSLCLNIKEEWVGDRGHCYGYIAIEKNDTTYCDKTGGYGQEECYSDMALAYSDMSFCRKIENQIVGHYCWYLVSEVNPKLAGSWD